MVRKSSSFPHCNPSAPPAQEQLAFTRQNWVGRVLGLKLSLALASMLKQIHF